MYRETWKNEVLNPGAVENALHYKEEEDKQTKLERHINVEHQDDERNAHSWKQEGKIDPKFNAHCNKFIGMMTELESM